nr:hypothetical protein [Nitrospira defluvii]
MSVYVVAKTRVLKLGGGEPVQIGVDQGKAAPVFMDQREGWAADGSGVGEQSVGHASNQRGLPRPQFAEQCDDFSPTKKGTHTLS